MPVLVVLAEHVRGRVVLKRVMAEQGLVVPAKEADSDESTAPRNPFRVSPELEAALGIASRMVHLTTSAPPAFVLLRPAQALPFSDIDWWIETPRGATNSWASLLVKWDVAEPEFRRLREVLAGPVTDPAGGSGREVQLSITFSLAHLMRLHALAGLRRGRPAAVLESLDALRSMEARVTGGVSAALVEGFRREAVRIRLAALVSGELDDAFLQALAPGRPGFEIPRAWLDEERTIRAEAVGWLREAPADELPTGRDSLWNSEFTDLAGGVDSTSMWGNALERVLGLLDKVAGPAKEHVLFPIWRFGWGDLAIAEYLRHSERLVSVSRAAVEARSWKVIEDSDEAGRGWYRRWLSPYSSWMGVGFLGGMMRMAFERQTEDGLCAAAIALERHRLKHGAYPERLDQLVPEFLGEVPVDWSCGEPLRYRREAGGRYRLYALGRDGEDNGGGGFDLKGRSVAVLVGIQFGPSSLWDDDVVWPTRGTAEQLQQAMDEQAKRLSEIGKPGGYGMDPELMRRYGLVPKTPAPSAPPPPPPTPGGAGAPATGK